MPNGSRLIVATLALATSFASLASGLLAQGTSRAGSGNPISQAIRQGWQTAQKNITNSAELMPEANYAFKPVDSVRTFGHSPTMVEYEMPSEIRRPNIILLSPDVVCQFM